MTDRRQLGALGEQQALLYLQQQGLALLARNWQCRQGELDLVMREDETVVFVEVRYRRRPTWGSALESIDGRKQQRLVRTAQAFLQSQSQWAQHPCRFDVLTFDGPSLQAHWIRNAFDTQ